MTSLYIALTAPEKIAPRLLWVFDVTGYMRFSSFLLMVCVFLLYNDYHQVCVKSREDEMRAVGLAERMHGVFSYRSSPSKYIDCALFPIAGILFGSAPAVHVQLWQFWTLNLVYTVSKKPQRKPAPFSSEMLV